jgi:hypothetical protein
VLQVFFFGWVGGIYELQFYVSVVLVVTIMLSYNGLSSRRCPLVVTVEEIKIGEVEGGEYVTGGPTARHAVPL